jgi:hypothetical protein
MDELQIGERVCLRVGIIDEETVGQREDKL